MKYLIASDLHGSAYYAQKLKEIFEAERADMLILLGDIYNHGPRNPLPEDYAPMRVAEILNGLNKKLMVIKGNCDSAVDTMISGFDFIDCAVITSKCKTVFLTHGHEYNKNNMPKTAYNAVIYGHFHTGFIEKSDSVTIANAGSLSLPKQGTANSYLTLEKGLLLLKDLDGKIIEQTEI